MEHPTEQERKILQGAARRAQPGEFRRALERQKELEAEVLRLASANTKLEQHTSRLEKTLADLSIRMHTIATIGVDPEALPMRAPDGSVVIPPSQAEWPQLKKGRNGH